MTQTILLVSVYWRSSPFGQQTFNKFQPAFDGYVCLQVPRGKLFMSLLTKRLVSIAASTILITLVSASANAQTYFHMIGDSNFTDRTSYDGLLFSSYTFNQSMILNSIGFYTNGVTMTEMSYSTDGVSRLDLSPSSTVDADGFRWYEFSGGKSISAGTTLRIYTDATNPPIRTPVRGTFGGVNYSNDVISYGGVLATDTWFSNIHTNSNIRVSEPGSNVAPEPGSFALALTGGAALIGICIRRRRNAA